MRPHYKLALSRYITALCLLLITQIVFYLLNASLFNVTSFTDFLNICLGNLRFTLSSLSFYLATFLFLSILPVPLHANKIYNTVTSVLYFAATELMLFVNLIDCGYFPFTFKRMTVDIFNYLGVGGDFTELIPQFLRDYWHIVLIFIILNIVLFKTDGYFRRRFKEEKSAFSAKTCLKETVFMLVLAFVLVVFQRGGLQKRPMAVIQASNYASTQNTALVLNTPYTLYRTIGKTSVQAKNYFDDKELESIFSPINNPNTEVWTDTLFTEVPQTGKTNVFIFILESFAGEYLATYNRQGPSYAPFLDSLAQHSIVFEGMSNGKKSIDGIPSIISSMPLLNETSYITSSYSENALGSIASTLKNHGYSTAFFHGGYNGTMNFDGFAKHVGFDDYYGKNEYNDDKDYDGNWGIFDEPFLQYSIKQIATMKEPFAVALFTISSHHPYTIPDKYNGKFPKGTLPHHETVGYTDNAIREFFKTASKQPWFKNTVFVFSADHSAFTQTKEFRTELGLYRIPIMIYSPMLKHGYRPNILLQQTDIYPTLNDMLHTGDKVFGYGKSVFSDFPHYYIYYSNGEYILLLGDYVSKYRDGFALQLFNAKTDPDMKNNIASENKSVADYHKKLTEAIIQQYNNRLIKNQTVIKE